MDQQFQDRPIQTSWVEGLALEELNMEESGVIQFNQHLNPEHYLEESSLKFMQVLKDRFEVYASKFNEFRGGASNSNHIKIFKISNTINDFMLFRNSLKLVIARKSRDLISIGFLSNTGGLYSARLNHEQPAINMAHEVRAHLGPFNSISWRFNGEPVEPDNLVRHYLTEFIKHSAR